MSNSNSLPHRYWSHVFGAAADRGFSVPTSAIEGQNAVHFNWHQAGVATAAVMSALRELGIKAGDKVAILDWNCPEWVWADLAIQSLGGVSVSIYPNDSESQVNYILDNSEAKLTISTSPDQLKKVAGGRKTLLLDLTGKSVNYRTGQTFLDSVGRDDVAAPFKGLWAELEGVKARMGEGSLSGIEPSQLATLIYTSGSSGTPKGCMITHDNIAAAVTSLALAGITQDPKKDRYVSYLPLAHVYERVNGMAMCLWDRVPVAFSTIDEMAKNVKTFSPTKLCGVPAVWQKIRDGVYNPKDGAPKFLNKIGLWAPLLNFAVNCEKDSRLGRILDKAIFSKIRAKMGGSLELLVSGGAPITPELLKFFNKLGLELLEGYGATETTGGVTTNLPSWVDARGNKVGSVGRAVPGIQVHINPLEGEDPNVGEIWIRGRQVISGYWKLPDATAAAFTSDGWYRTSDLGRIDVDGFIYITGRMDGMYKTLGGKYVAREKVEKAFQSFPIVHYTVPVAHGRKFCTALIFVNHAQAKLLLNKEVPAGVDAGAWYAEQPEVVKAIADAVAGANAGLQQWEQVKKFKIMPIEATIEGGIITATMKIRSKELIKRFAAVIDELYANSSK